MVLRHLNDITDRYNKIGEKIDTTTNKAGDLNNEMGDTPPASGGGSGGTGATIHHGGRQQRWYSNIWC